MSAPAVIELSGVSKRYQGTPSVVALEGVDLRLERGELVAIIGPSGSGKTTLLSIMGTLERPSTGWVRIVGDDTSALSDRVLSGLRARSIGFVFQQFFLVDALSLRENVASGLLYTGVRRSARLDRADEVVRRLGLAHRADHSPSRLSGGEKQRVAIARALVGEPALLLADEPTGNLDSVSGAAIIELLRELNAGGTTVAVITHDHGIAGQMRRQVELRDGRIVADSWSVPAAAG